MRVRRVLALTLLLTLLAFSGCLGDDEIEQGPQYGTVVREPVPSHTPAAQATPAPEPSPPPASNTTASPAPPPDDPPSAAIVTSRTRGTAPLTVEFELKGDDPEGRNITWTFDADGDGVREGHGTELPARWTHVYERGTWEAVLRVSDTNGTTKVHARIEAVPPAPTGPPEPVRLRGTLTGMWVQGTGYVPETHNQTFELPRAVEQIEIVFYNGPTALDLDYEVFAPDGRTIAERRHFNEPSGQLPPPFAGTVEPKVVVTGADAARTGIWTIRVMPALAVEGEYVIDVHFA